ncbi:MAG: cell division inhibitor [Aeromonas sp.]
MNPAHFTAISYSNEPCLNELAMLSNTHTGWILLLSPPGLPTVTHLQTLGINPNKVLIVHSQKIKNWQQTLERCLGNTHHAAVLTWLPDDITLDHQKLQQLGERSGILTRFFGASKQTITTHMVNFGQQDIYLHH